MDDEVLSWFSVVLQLLSGESGNNQQPRCQYSGRKITESLGNVTVRGGKRWKEQGESTMANSLSEHV
jgi:hypothetical protein